MAGSARKKLFCPECNTVKLEGDFYRSNDKEKFPLGRLPICKRCRTMLVDNWNSDTFIDIMQDCDVPFIPQEWNRLLETYGQEPEKCSGTTIMGRYLSKMQLKQFIDLRWVDTELYQEKLAQEIRDVMIYQGFSAEEIEKAIEEDRKLLPGPGYSIPALPQAIESRETEEKAYNADGTVANADLIQDYFASDDDVSYENDLTSEDKKILRLKWGKTYSVDELIRLEKLYREMEESFDIQTASHRDTLIKACKTSLKSEQLLDIGDVEGAQKMVKMYETLMKMGKFTAVQNKTEQGECLDSISELVLMCERIGFIPRFYISSPNDKVDETIEDLKEYTADLFKGESNLESMIEMAVKQIHEQESKEEDEDIDDEDEISLDDVETIVKDEDFVEYNEYLQEEQQMSEEALANFVKSLNREEEGL